MTTTQTAYIHFTDEEPVLGFETFGKETFSAGRVQPLTQMTSLCLLQGITESISGAWKSRLQRP